MPISNRAINRIKKSLNSDYIPISNYKKLGWGRRHETISDDEFSDLIDRITNKEQGLLVATNILAMRFFGESEVVKHSESLIETGKSLLAKVDFQLDEFQNDEVDHDLAQIIRICLKEHDGKILADSMMESLIGTIKYVLSYPSQFNEVLSAILQAQPLGILNLLLVEEDECHYGRMSIFELNIETNDGLLNHLDNMIIESWCDENPEIRYPLIGEHMLLYKYESENGQIVWLELFGNLVKKAPKLENFLDGVEKNFTSKTYYTFDEEILRSRLRLFESLFDNENIILARWAHSVHVKADAEYKDAYIFDDYRNREVQDTFE